jgi:gliding motility-associated-like protein
VTVTDANNCTAVSNAEVITMSCPLATISVNPPSDTVFVHDTATLIATAVGGSSYSYQWYSDSAQIILPNTLDSVHAVINTPRMDSIYLVITDLSTQCTDTVVQVVHAIDFAGFVMGDAFTPNGDGVNDYFYPVLSDSTNSTAKVEAFRIYNRWGQMVYNSTVRPGWDGNFANQSQPAGAYLYFVTISYPDPNNPSRLITKSLEGTVMLLR